MIGDLRGLVLAGGRSVRMGRDKAFLEYGGEPQIERAHRLLAGCCGGALVSIRPDQSEDARFARFDVVLDDPAHAGPAAGLVAAWRRMPGIPLLVLAVDLPCVDAPTLRLLLDSRDSAAAATAFEHPDGTLEPLCTVWEAHAAKELGQCTQTGSVSLRRVLENVPVKRVKPPQPGRLRNVNSAEEYAALRDLSQL